jgi:hypothetical protein
MDVVSGRPGVSLSLKNSSRMEPYKKIKKKHLATHSLHTRVTVDHHKPRYTYFFFGVLYDSGDLYKDVVFGSVCSCMTICTRLVCVSGVCVCWVGVRVYV